MAHRLRGKSLVHGTASGRLLASSIPLSFWGGVDPSTGNVVDHHHPLQGHNVAGRVLLLPSSRGSCTGSTVMLELLLNGTAVAPAGLIVAQDEEVLTVGVLVAQALFGVSIPVLVLPAAEDFDTLLLRGDSFVAICGDEVVVSDEPVTIPQSTITPPKATTTGTSLSARDRTILAGGEGPATKVALEIILSFAAAQNTTTLLDVSQAHIDACIYTGPASLKFAQTLQSLGARCVVPTTLNAISIDQRRWKEIGIEPTLASQADLLAQTYLAMGAAPSFTCAPYVLDTAPATGENIGWGESNAVIFANSVLGARTQKYPDFIDVCIAVTGRAPSSGCHLDEGRRPTFLVDVKGLRPPSSWDDALYPLLGHLIGTHAQHRIPLIRGLESFKPSHTDLKAFSAAFGTTASAPMFHMLGVTPESAQFAEDFDRKEDDRRPPLPVELTQRDLAEHWRELNTARDPSVGLVSLGNPHFSLDEMQTLAHLCTGRSKSDRVEMMITTSRDVERKASKAGYLQPLTDFGAVIITDTCWCMLREPVISPAVRNLMTNSAKYAHYAPGMVGRGVHFGSLAQCVEAACKGEVELEAPDMDGVGLSLESHVITR